MVQILPMRIEAIVNILEQARHNTVYGRQIPRASLNDRDAPQKNVCSEEMAYQYPSHAVCWVQQLQEIRYRYHSEEIVQLSEHLVRCRCERNLSIRVVLTVPMRCIGGLKEPHQQGVIQALNTFPAQRLKRGQ